MTYNTVIYIYVLVIIEHVSINTVSIGEGPYIECHRQYLADTVCKFVIVIITCEVSIRIRTKEQRTRPR